ncbi:MAG: hypothetical protein COB76_04215 [Alphaproteobacteria bacterium]|nr:MAG: hypothetical protein COB76_04215 [Alphaproteobacteria bacterium]
MFGLKVFKYLLKIPTLIFCVAFVVLNMQDTTFYFSPIASPLTLPLWALGLTLFALGFTVGALLVWLNSLPKNKELRQARKELKKANEEREELEDTLREARTDELHSIDDKVA